MHMQVMTKDSAVGGWFANEYRQIERSYKSLVPYRARMYRRSNLCEDPWLQPEVDHSSRTALYGECDYNVPEGEGKHFSGLNVYIRKHSDFPQRAPPTNTTLYFGMQNPLGTGFGTTPSGTPVQWIRLSTYARASAYPRPAQTISNGALHSVGGGCWASGAYSAQVLAGDGGVRFRLERESDTMVGLAIGNDGHYHEDIDCALYGTNGDLRSYELGKHVHTFGSYTSDDWLAVRRIGEEIKFYRNDVYIGKCRRTTRVPLVVDVSLCKSNTPSVIEAYFEASENCAPIVELGAMDKTKDSECAAHKDAHGNYLGGPGLVAAYTLADDPDLGVTDGMLLWFDASEQSGSSVITWADKSGNGYDAVQQDGAARLVAGGLNSMNTLVFDGNYMRINKNVPLVRTMTAVFRSRRSYYQNHGAFLNRVLGRTCNWLFENEQHYLHANQYPARVWKNGVEVNSNFNLAPVDDWMVVTIQVANSCGASAMYVGRSDAYQTPIDVAEIVAYNKVYSDTERVAIETYLTKKWLHPRVAPGPFQLVDNGTVFGYTGSRSIKQQASFQRSVRARFVRIIPRAFSSRPSGRFGVVVRSSSSARVVSGQEGRMYVDDGAAADYMDNQPCMPFGGTCPNGVLMPPARRTRDDQCGVCAAGFYLEQATASCRPCQPGTFKAQANAAATCLPKRNACDTPLLVAKASVCAGASLSQDDQQQQARQRITGVAEGRFNERLPDKVLSSNEVTGGLEFAITNGYRVRVTGFNQVKAYARGLVQDTSNSVVARATIEVGGSQIDAASGKPLMYRYHIYQYDATGQQRTGNLVSVNGGRPTDTFQGESCWPSATGVAIATSGKIEFSFTRRGSAMHLSWISVANLGAHDGSTTGVLGTAGLDDAPVSSRSDAVQIDSIEQTAGKPTF